MAIAYHSEAHATPGSSNVNNTNWTHNIPSGLVDSCLFILAAWRNSGGGSYVISSVTRGGSAAGISLVSGPHGQDSGSGRRTAIYRLVGPSVANSTIQVNFSGNVWVAQGGSILLQGVHQTTPTGTANGQNISGDSNPTLNVNTLYSNNWIVETLTIREDGTSPYGTPQSSQSLRWGYNHTQGYGLWGGGATKGPNSSGNVAVNWTLVTENDASQSAIEVQPSAAAGIFLPIISDRGIHSAIFGGQIVR